MSPRLETTAEKIVENIPLDEIREALINEYRRRFMRYKMIDESMKKKYGMNFSEFEFGNVVRENKFSWEVESDSMEWEHAIEGLRYADQKLKDLKQI